MKKVVRTTIKLKNGWPNAKIRPGSRSLRKRVRKLRLGIVAWDSIHIGFRAKVKAIQRPRQRLGSRRIRLRRPDTLQRRIPVPHRPVTPHQDLGLQWTRVVSAAISARNWAICLESVQTHLCLSNIFNRFMTI